MKLFIGGDVANIRQKGQKLDCKMPRTPKRLKSLKLKQGDIRTDASSIRLENRIHFGGMLIAAVAILIGVKFF